MGEFSENQIFFSRMNRLTVEFYYDVVSPYSWIAFEVFSRYVHSKRWDINLELKPFFLGGIMQATGNKPPATVPAKAVYMTTDLERNALYFKIPIKLPLQFPINSLNAMRLLTVVKSESPKYLESISRALWLRYWSRQQDITQPESLEEACISSGVSKEDAQKWLQMCSSSVTKESLKTTTDEAVNKGAFGAPTYFVRKDGKSGEDMLFGSDRFPIFATLFELPWDGPFPLPKSNL